MIINGYQARIYCVEGWWEMPIVESPVLDGRFPDKFSLEQLVEALTSEEAISAVNRILDDYSSVYEAYVAQFGDDATMEEVHAKLPDVIAEGVRSAYQNTDSHEADLTQNSGLMFVRIVRLQVLVEEG